MIPIFYRPEMSCASNESDSPSAGKPRLVVEDWLANPDIAPHIQVEHFSPADNDMLCEAHDPDYVDHVMSCMIDNGFGNDNPKVAASLRYTVGSIVAACKYVLTTPSRRRLKVAVSPSSGFHHAGYGFGGGFCTFNGLMVAAIRVHALGLAKRILILDFDQHNGNGTQDIIDRLKIDYVDHITARQDYNSAEEVLQVLGELGNRLAERNGVRPYDLVIYQAGADIHVDDPYGGLLTTGEMRERDIRVFERCFMSATPLVWNLAGGYQRDRKGTIEPVLALHRQTMLQCIIADTRYQP